MNRQERAAARQAAKQAKKQKKAHIRHVKKIKNGLDLCIIAACFLTCLTAAVLQYFRKDAGNR